MFTPAELIAMVDRTLCALRERWLTALDRGPRERLRSEINATLDQRLDLMRLRDCGHPVHLVVLPCSPV